jgi:hypothetical protein
VLSAHRVDSTLKVASAARPEAETGLHAKFIAEYRPRQGQAPPAGASLVVAPSHVTPLCIEPERGLIGKENFTLFRCNPITTHFPIIFFETLPDNFREKDMKTIRGPIEKPEKKNNDNKNTHTVSFGRPS